MAEIKITAVGDEVAIAALQNVAKAMGDVSNKADQAGAAHKDFSGAADVASAHAKSLSDVINDVGSKFGISTSGVTGFLGPLGEVSAVAAGAITTFAAVAAGLYELGEKSVESGDHLNNMALKMGVGKVQAGQLDFAITVAGGNVDSLSNAVFMMSKRLEDSGSAGDAARKALAGVGIDAKAFMDLPIDKQILAVSDAFRQTVPTAGQVSDIFNRQGKEILPELMKPLSELAGKYADLHGRTTEQIEAAANEAMASREVSAEWGLLVTQLGQEFLPVMEAVTETLGLGVTSIRAAGEAIGWLGGMTKEALELVGLWNDEQIKTPPAMAANTKGMEHYLASMIPVVALAPTMAQAYETAQQAIKDLDKQMADSAKAATAWASVAAEIKKIQDQTLTSQEEFNLKGLALEEARLHGQEIAEDDAWKKRFDTHTINQEQLGKALAAIDEKYAQLRANAIAADADAQQKRADERAKVEQKTADERAKVEQKTADTIAHVWQEATDLEAESGERGLTLQLDKLARQEANEKAAAAFSIANEKLRVEALAAIDHKYAVERHIAITKNEEDIADQTQALWVETDRLTQKGALSTADYQIAQVKRWYDDQRKAADAAGNDSKTYYDGLAALAKAKMDEVRQSHDQTFQAIHKLQDDLQTNWETTFDETLKKTHSFGKSFKDVFYEIKHDVQSVFYDLLGSIVKEFLQPLLDQVSSVTTSISKAISGALSGAASSSSYVASDIAKAAGSGGSAAAAGGGAGLLGGGLVGGLATAGIGAAVVGGIMLAEHFFGPSEESKIVNPERDSWFAQHGNLRSVNEAVQGVTGDVRMVQAVFDAQTDAEFKRATAAIHNAGVPGFAGGTGGDFVDFGAGTPAVLHGKERIMTEREGKGVEDRLDTLARKHDLLAAEIKNMLSLQPMLLRHALRGT